MTWIWITSMKTRKLKRRWNLKIKTNETKNGGGSIEIFKSTVIIFLFIKNDLSIFSGN